MSFELHSLETYDGVTYLLQDGAGTMLLNPTPDDMGLPPTNYITQRTYKQDGVTEQAFYLEERTFTIDWTKTGCSREEYFAARAALLDIARPNRGGSPGYTTYHFVRTDGTRRSIRGRLISPRYAGGDQDAWDEWSITETLTIRCFDPVWFDPAENSATITSAAATDLVFPITFPIVFGDASLYQQTVISYTGTWYSFPTVQITGPCSGFQIEHQELGLFLIYTPDVAAGEVLTFQLGNPATLVNQDGDDLFGGLAPLSEVQAFRIQPTPLVTGGVNTIRFYAPDATGATDFALQYFTRYIGI